MPGLLFPAYQKFYSALKCLERFDKEKNFFDNISSLDNFFAEYRNITFAIQSAIRHTDHFAVYEANREKYLDHWFVDKRNETTKQQPFQLVKQIDISIYLPDDSLSVCSRAFTVEDDVPMESLNDELKELLTEVSPYEVCFSAKFSFYEKGTSLDLWDKLVAGIASMVDFMDFMYKEVDEDCPLCNQLREKIHKSKFAAVPKDFWLVNDYTYYPQKDEFERAGRLALVLSADGQKVASRSPIQNLTKAEHLNYDGTPFGTFVLMHALIRAIRPGADIMPVLLVVYNDDTYDMDAFHADMKTTVYRKINEVAERVSADDIRQVCFMTLYAYIPNTGDVPKTSRERLAISTTDVLAFASVDQDLKEMEYVFDGAAMTEMEYVAHVMKYGRKNQLDTTRLNMTPIIEAFKAKSGTSSSEV